MKIFVLPEPLAAALRKYLVTKPYFEVHELITALHSLNVATLTEPPLDGAKKLAKMVEDKFEENKQQQKEQDVENKEG